MQRPVKGTCRRDGAKMRRVKKIYKETVGWEEPNTKKNLQKCDALNRFQIDAWRNILLVLALRGSSPLLGTRIS